MARAYRNSGYALSQIADAAGLHYGTVSKINQGMGDGRECKKQDLTQATPAMRRD